MKFFLTLALTALASSVWAQDAPPPPRVAGNPPNAPTAPDGFSDAQLAQVEMIVSRALARNDELRATTPRRVPVLATAQVETYAPPAANLVRVIVPPGPFKRAFGHLGQSLAWLARPRTRQMILAPAGATMASPQR